MTAAETAPPIRLDRYLALLAILLGLVLALLVIGEREKPPAPPPAVVGTLPPPPDPRVALIAAEREALLAERARLTAALEASEAALARAQAEAVSLALENERLRQLAGDEGAALGEIERRLTAAETERDRLRDEVTALTRTRQQQEARLAELQGELGAARAALADARGAAAIPSLPTTPSTSFSTAPSTAPPTADDVPAGTSGAAPDVPIGEPGREPDTATPALPEAAAEAPVVDAAELAGPPAAGSLPPEAGGLPQRLTTFEGQGDGDGGTVEDGVEAYRVEDYARAERIWGALAAAGDRRAQFYFGSLLFEGRTGPPDRVMAHVWLSRSVDNGYLPAIEVRRQVRAAMSETEYEAALAIEADG
jgi:TPR repeat protein